MYRPRFLILILILFYTPPGLAIAQYNASQMVKIGEIYGELMGTKYLYGAYLESECGQLLPPGFSKNKNKINAALKEIKEKLPEAEKNS